MERNPLAKSFRVKAILLMGLNPRVGNPGLQFANTFGVAIEFQSPAAGSGVGELISGLRFLLKRVENFSTK